MITRVLRAPQAENVARKQALKKQRARAEAAADPSKAKRRKMWWEEELEAAQRGRSARDTAEEDAAYFREEVSNA
jgi:hypothetical protein